VKVDVKLSTRFLTTQNAHQVGLLTTIEGEVPLRRAPINLALVLDRSGSMAGAKLAAAKTAAARFASHLGAGDTLSVVTFDSEVTTVFGPAPADSDAAATAIAQIHEGGQTNLSGGWLQGRSHVEAGLLADGVNRVLLFTDGQANAGIVEHGQLVALARSAAEQRITTTCIGFGSDFNEDLLRDMGAAGGANYWYVENVDQMATIFDEEIEGLVALAAQNLEVQIRLEHPRVQGLSFLQHYPVTRSADGAYIVRIGDLYATSPRGLGLVFHVEDVAELGQTAIGQVRVVADVVLEQGVEHRVITMPVVANLDGSDHVEPTVERVFLRYEVARAREEAVKKADGGDFDGASLLLREASVALKPHLADPAIAEEAEDLVRESERMKEREYASADRKYHLSRSQGIMEEKRSYMDKISRRKRP